jgi:hypothetical protein
MKSPPAIVVVLPTQAEQQLKAERIEAEIMQREQRLEAIRGTVRAATRRQHGADTAAT